tara:strand:- start:8 stop:124 length:117 start_codon:yes stop_codon:yes gene_type:complete
MVKKLNHCFVQSSHGGVVLIADFNKEKWIKRNKRLLKD